MHFTSNRTLKETGQGKKPELLQIRKDQAQTATECNVGAQQDAGTGKGRWWGKPEQSLAQAVPTHAPVLHLWGYARYKFHGWA